MIAEFPEYYQWHSVKEFQWGDIKQPNRNRLLWRDGYGAERAVSIVSSARFQILDQRLRIALDVAFADLMLQPLLFGHDLEAIGIIGYQ